MLCLTGNERTTSALCRRLRGRSQAKIQEVRLDLLETIDDSALDLLASDAIIATCRSKTEGGGFRGSQQQRIEILERALERSPGYIDVELTTPLELRRRLYSRRGSTQLILSWHPGPATDKEQLRLGLQRLGDEPADLLKIACPVEDVVELEALLELLQDQRRPVIRIGTGEAGLLSRVLYRRFGAPWTYVVKEEAAKVAPGQLSLAGAEMLRVAEADTLTPLALLGGPQVLASAGPVVYNRLFRQHRLPYLYLPVVTARPAATLALLERLGFGGCSVTMPAKEALVDQLQQLWPPAHSIGAINTVVFHPAASSKDPPVRVGLNTDQAAVRNLLRRFAGQAALVLGAGGAARAAVVALRALGCAVTVSSRRFDRAQALVEQLGGECCSWAARAAANFMVLVNATPCGTDGVSDPMSELDDWRGRIVLDAVVPQPSQDTPLVRRVLAGGGLALDGRCWWVEQGALQLQALTGQRFSATTLREQLDDARAS